MRKISIYHRLPSFSMSIFIEKVLVYCSFSAFNPHASPI